MTSLLPVTASAPARVPQAPSPAGISQDAVSFAASYADADAQPGKGKASNVLLSPAVTLADDEPRGDVVSDSVQIGPGVPETPANITVQLSIQLPAEKAAGSEAAPMPIKNSVGGKIAPKPQKKQEAAATNLVVPVATADNRNILLLRALTFSIHGFEGTSENAPSGETADAVQITPQTPRFGDASSPQVAAPDAVDVKEAPGNIALQISAQLVSGKPASVDTATRAKLSVTQAAAAPSHLEAEQEPTLPEPPVAHDAHVLNPTTFVVPEPNHSPAADSKSPASPQPLKEAALIETPQPAPQSPREFSIKLDAMDRVAATVHIRELAGGQFRVNVHTPDAELMKSLRLDADSLTDRLESAGIKAEVTQPAQTRSSSNDAAGSQSAESHQGQSSASGNTNEAEGDRQYRRSRWLEEMEKRNASH